MIPHFIYPYQLFKVDSYLFISNLVSNAHSLLILSN